MTRPTKRGIEKAVDDLEDGVDATPRDALWWGDFIKVAHGDAAPGDFGVSRAEFDAEWIERHGHTMRGDGAPAHPPERFTGTQPPAAAIESYVTHYLDHVDGDESRAAVREYYAACFGVDERDGR